MWASFGEGETVGANEERGKIAGGLEREKGLVVGKAEF